jgi:hypothetical protein
MTIDDGCAGIQGATDVMFKVNEPGAALRTEMFCHSIIKIGGDRKSHICLANTEAASRMHAVVEVTPDGKATYIDLGNEPGSYVNGARINKCKLKKEDEIRIGDTTILFKGTVTKGDIEFQGAVDEMVKATGCSEAQARETLSKLKEENVQWVYADGKVTKAGAGCGHLKQFDTELGAVEFGLQEENFNIEASRKRIDALIIHRTKLVTAGVDKEERKG